MHDTPSPFHFAAVEATARELRTRGGAVTVSEIASAAYAAGRTAGWYAGRLDLSAREADVREAWMPAGRDRAEERAQERIAQSEQYAAEVAVRLGRRPGYQYRGGEVDWQTGLPAKSTVETSTNRVRRAA